MPLPPLVEPVAALSDAERIRTARHRVLAGFGETAQRRLAAAHVALVGAGGLGSPAVLALAAAGVGRITVVDDDVVEASNLQRQVLHRLGDLGLPKAESAVRAAADLSPETRVDTVVQRLSAQNASMLLADADIVLDGSDTFDTRVVVADACDRLGLPLVWGTVQEFHAQVTVFWSRPPEGHGPVTLADLYPPGSAGEVPTCADVGVLGALCMQVGSLMAQQAILLATGVGEPLLGRLLVLDSLHARQRVVPLLGSRGAAGTTSVPVAAPASAPPVPALGPVQLEQALSSPDAPLVVDVRRADELLALPALAGALHLPLDELLADPDAAAARFGAARVVTMCHSGVRSRTAAEALREAGVDAASATGGMVAWQAHTATAARAAEGAAHAVR